MYNDGRLIKKEFKKMQAFTSPFASLSSNAKTYMGMYQPKSANVVRVAETDINSLIQSRGFEQVNNQVPNSIAKSYFSSELGARLDTRA